MGRALAMVAMGGHYRVHPIAWLGLLWCVAVVTTGAAAEEQGLLQLDAEGGDYFALLGEEAGEQDGTELMEGRRGGGLPVVKAARTATTHAQKGKEALEKLKKTHPSIVAAKKAAKAAKRGAKKLKKMKAKVAKSKFPALKKFRGTKKSTKPKKSGLSKHPNVMKARKATVSARAGAKAL